MKPVFITGIGTGVGKTLVAAILTEALQADYWKPVQAGYENGTDAELVRSLISNSSSRVHAETYKLKLAVSPHIAARKEGISISLEKIFANYFDLNVLNPKIIIEGAGGLLAPLNETEFVADLIKKLNARVILVSRNYLGSINHSLLTAQACRVKNLRVLGWIFTDHYMNYEDDIARWSGYPKLASVPKLETINKETIAEQAGLIDQQIIKLIS